MQFVSIIAPLSAIIAVIITTAFNFFDRRRFYQLERDKIVRDAAATLLENSDYIREKFAAYNGILKCLSTINQGANELKLQYYDGPESDPGTERFAALIKRESENIVGCLVAHQLVIPPATHKRISRVHIPFLISQLAGMAEEKDLVDKQRRIREILTRNDALKDHLHKEFHGKPDSTWGVENDDLARHLGSQFLLPD